MVTGTGGITCHNCGQSNSGGGQFCVRCGDRLPEQDATTFGSGPHGGEHPWEPPAEWTPDPAWTGGNAAAPAQAWDESSRTWGPSGGSAGGGAYTPPPNAYPPGGGFQQPGYQQPPYQQGGYRHYEPTPPPRGRSRVPLFAGFGALVVVALVVLGIVLFGGGSDSPSTPGKPAVALNGEETKTPEAILDDARVNLRTTSGVHAAGNVTSDGENIRLDLDFTGNAVKGVLTISGNDVQIIKIGDEVYLKGDRDFYLSVAKGDEAAVNTIGTKWLKATGDDAKEFNDFSLDGFADAFKVNDSDSKLNPTVGREDFLGQPAVVLTQSDGSRLLVANTGKAYPLRIENKNSADAGQIDFTNYEKPVSISAPSASDVLDLSEVG